jgi:hypothetical protein
MRTPDSTKNTAPARPTNGIRKNAPYVLMALEFGTSRPSSSPKPTRLAMSASEAPVKSSGSWTSSCVRKIVTPMPANA